MRKLTAIAILCIAGAHPSWASSTARLDFTQLSRQADRVVAGKIVEITSDADPETGYIYSNVTLSVASAIPSVRPGAPYEFRMIGGEFGGKKLWIADFPELRAGQEVVLFLTRETSSVFGPTVGLWQGVYFVERDRGTGAEQVVDHSERPVLGIRGGDAVLGLGPGPSGQQTKPPKLPPLGIEQFMEAVLAARRLPIEAGTLVRP